MLQGMRRLRLGVRRRRRPSQASLEAVVRLRILLFSPRTAYFCTLICVALRNTAGRYPGKDCSTLVAFPTNNSSTLYVWTTASVTQSCLLLPTCTKTAATVVGELSGSKDTRKRVDPGWSKRMHCQSLPSQPSNSTASSRSEVGQTLHLRRSVRHIETFREVHT